MPKNSNQVCFARGFEKCRRRPDGSPLIDAPDSAAVVVFEAAATDRPRGDADHWRAMQTVPAEGQTGEEARLLLAALQQRKPIRFLVRHGVDYGFGRPLHQFKEMRLIFETCRQTGGAFDPSRFFFVTVPGQSQKELSSLVAELERLRGTAKPREEIPTTRILDRRPVYG